MSQIETLRSMEVNEKLHGITMNLGEFLKTVLEGGFFSYSASLTTPGMWMLTKFANIIFLTALQISNTIIGPMLWFDSFSDKVDKKDKGPRRS